MPHVSPSQISTRSKCVRKWAYSRQRPRTSNKYAVYGTRTHEHREKWLKHGTPPDATTPEGRTAIAGLEHLPMPGTCGVEVPIKFDYENVRYVGFVDALQFEPTTHVHDHKTCGTFDYALTADDLLDDPQRIIYSYWAAVVTGAPYVQATWHYLRRKPPACRPVTMAEHTGGITKRFVKLHREFGLPIIQDAGRPPEELPRSLDHCGAYGGCPYADECLEGVSPIQRAAAALNRYQNKP